ncbi:glycosyltransferase family 4 protein [Kineosporia succinea]|uniref:Phosphatidylinositol alpha-mannosyltransferase n=1 Tax=Kineosporia succinea TaxID=84632 RepID=A0ABT9NV92_9ACTN|nr:glycosyltransferase family 4 protein [Kineosporia succinea]MDP9824347.1 phosphatidylinositol alpha-mannosyltransferase [Kineosporia succinea]
MRIGMVSPYSFHVPGGVQFHIRDVAEHLIGQGHHVSVLAPSDDDTPLPPYISSAGRAVPLPYNGSIARISFGPVASSRVKRWLAENDFDVLHVHEPSSPSLSMLAMWAATGPIVATFHTSNPRSRAMSAAYPLLRPGFEKLSARIAVSEDARRTVVDHLGGDAVVIPNGVFVDRFAAAPPRPEWQGTPGRPAIAFLGRLDEPRKGLPVLAAALPALLERHPGLRVLVLGRGEAEEALAAAGPARGAVELLGALDDDAKASLLRSVDAYVAPHIGGESFGIVLVEAMSAGAPVIASDLGAFRRVLDEGALGLLARTGDPDALAAAVSASLENPDQARERAARASVAVRRYDWPRVAAQVLDVYETVTIGADKVGEDPRLGLLARWRPKVS